MRLITRVGICYKWIKPGLVIDASGFADATRTRPQAIWVVYVQLVSLTLPRWHSFSQSGAGLDDPLRKGVSVSQGAFLRE